jgi:radical SAM superfamily enzyme YgiQ (UPF0313 family)
MKILFIQTNNYTLLRPLPIGPAYVARRLERDGHAVRFLDLMGERDSVRATRDAATAFSPDLVCLSVRNRDNMMESRYFDPIPGIAAVAAAVRESSPSPLLLGGTAFTSYPSRLLDRLNAEYGIAGDDLDAISRFVASLASGSPDLETPGLVYRDSTGRIVANPFEFAGYRKALADHHAMIDRKRYRRAFWQAAVVTRSGCPEKCIFCDVARTFGNRFILREPGEVAEEILSLKRNGETRSVWLIDAGFNRPLDHAKEVLREIVRRGAQLRLYAVFDPGEADKEFFQLYRRAGGVMLTLFAESLSDSVLRELRKSFGAAEIFRDTRTMREEGIAFLFMPTFGGPGETRETVAETLRRTPSLKATFTEFSVGWRIQPGAELRERAIREGLLEANDDCWEPHFYVSPDTPREWLKGELRNFKFRHPLLSWRVASFIASYATRRPWRWSAEPA